MPGLKLVISNPANPVAVQGDTSFQSAPSGTEFTVEIKNRGSHLYEMAIQDPCHHLGCSLILEIEERWEPELKRMVCHVPSICDEHLEEFVGEDDTLYWAFMIQFQMKTLEQLFLFCGSRDVSQLIIYTDDMQAGEAGVYRELLMDFIGYEQLLTNNNEQNKFVIPSTPQTLDAWTRFMQKTNINLGQALWRNQRSSPVTRRYLKYATLAGPNLYQDIA